MMNYWILTTEFPPFYGGGISTYCKETADMMAANGHNVSVFIADHSVEGIRVFHQENIRIIRFRPALTDAHTFMGFTAAMSYEYAEIVKITLLAEGAPDILESQDYNGIAYFIEQFKWQGIAPFDRLKIVITGHAPSFICLEYNHVPVYQFPDYWTGEMEKASIKSADLVIFPSRFLQKDIQQRIGLEGVNHLVVPNPLAGWSAAETIANIEKNMIVCFGKLSPLKGTFELLAYFKKLWDSGSPLQLVFVGGTDYFFYPEKKTMLDVLGPKYKSYIGKKQLVFTGNLKPEASAVYLHKASLIVAPSLFDNLPYTVLEVMSLGKIVLASRQGGQTEIITHGQDGFLFDHKKENDFHRQLQMILALTPVQRQTIEENARRTVQEKYNPQVIYHQKMQALESLLQRTETIRSYPFIHHIAEVESDAGSDEPAGGINFSLVIPYFNMGNYIDDCLVSVLNSTCAPDEVLLINDGSTDGPSIAKLAELENKYSLQIITRDNHGLPATRNYGAGLAKGRFVAFLDADDTVERAYYSRALAILGRYDNVHFAGCWLTYFGEGRGVWPTFNPEPPYILVHNTLNSSSLVFKRKTFLQHGVNKSDMIYGMEDWETIIQLTSKGFRGVAIPEKLFNYRVRKGSMAQSFTREKQLYLYRLIGEKHRSFYNIFGAEIAQILHSNGPGMYFDNPTFEVAVSMPSKRLQKYKNMIRVYAKKNKVIKSLAYFIYKKIK